MKTHDRNPQGPHAMGTRTAVLLAALLAAPLVVAGGCKSTKPVSTLEDTMAQVAQRRSEAIRLTDQAFRAQESGRLDRAEEFYRQALSLDGSISAAWNNLGEILLSQGYYQDAVQAFSEAAALSPADPRPEYNIAVAYQKSGWAEDALTHYGNALGRDPNYRPAIRGGIKAAAELGTASRDIHGWIRKGLLNETEESWRDFFEQQRFRVEAALEDELRHD